jgi:Flp pilus assembly pilin Flp
MTAAIAARRAQAGQGMVEYALILTLVAVVVLVMLLTTGKQVTNLFSDITNTRHRDAGL